MTNPFGAPQYKTVRGFRLRVYGSTLQVEEAFMETVRLNRINAAVPYLKLAERIAKKHGVEDIRALNAVQNFASGADISLVSDCIDELQKLEADTPNYDKLLPALLATLVIQTRCDRKWLGENASLLEEAFGVILDDTGWQDYHTDQLPLDVRIDLADFMTQEMSGLRDEDIEPAEAESLGKQLNGSQRPAKRQKRTGNKSTTLSNSQDIPIPAGIETTSEISLLASSSAP
jgi:hypothetical protein